MPPKNIGGLQNALRRIKAGYENQPIEGRAAPAAFARIEKSKVGREPVLILTGTIDPKGMTGTKLLDPIERENDYLSAFQLWVNRSSFKRIIFCENSVYDLSQFMEVGLAGKEIEVLGFSGNSFDHKLGKGFGEMEILNYVMDNSRVLSKDDRLVKCTGRLYVRNEKRFYEHALRETFDVSADLYRSLDESDVRLILFSPYFYNNYLRGRQSLLDESVHPQQLLEKIVAQAICHAMVDLLQFKPLPATPNFVGRSGSSNYRYSYWTTYFGRKLKAIPKRWL